jgi:hypothetical protein
LHPKQLTTAEITAAYVQAEMSGNELVLALANECLSHRRRRIGGELLAESGVSLATGDPFVRITWSEQEGQLDPSGAKGLGQSIIDAAYSAEHDAFFCRFLEREVGLSREKAAAALGDLRQMRAEKVEEA